jgi:hypothetical protein
MQVCVQHTSCKFARHSLFTMATAIIMPDDVAEEKVNAIKALGANVERVRPASIVDKKQVRVSKNPLMHYEAHTVAVCCKSQVWLYPPDNFHIIRIPLEPCQTTGCPIRMPRHD